MQGRSRGGGCRGAERWMEKKEEREDGGMVKWKVGKRCVDDEARQS